MRVTSCPDCGEVVEIPENAEALEEVTCPTCGLSGPADEWRSYAPEDDESLLGRPLADATIPVTVLRNWAIRIEQLEEIKDVLVELQHQIRLLRQALDELNEDLPERIKRWFDAWHSEITGRMGCQSDCQRRQHLQRRPSHAFSRPLLQRYQVSPSLP